jgi:hypothetical protein
MIVVKGEAYHDPKIIETQGASAIKGNPKLVFTKWAVSRGLKSDLGRSHRMTYSLRGERSELHLTEIHLCNVCITGILRL